MAKEVKTVEERFRRQAEVYLDTGIPLFDMMLSQGKGLPLGRFIEVTSESALGKSTLLLFIASYLCAQGKKVVYLDFEEGVSEDIMAKMNLMKPYEDKLFLPLNPVTYKGMEETFDQYVSDPTCPLIIVDSITAVLPSKIVSEDSSVEDNTIGVKARLDSNFLLKYKAQVKEAKKSVVFVTQRRTQIDMRMPSRTHQKSAVGLAFEFYMDIRIQLNPKGKIEKEVQTLNGTQRIQYGVNAEVVCFKNRCGPSGIPIILPIIYGKGVSNILALGNILTQLGFVRQSGSYFIVNFDKWVDQKFQGYKGYNEFIRQNYDEIFKIVKSANTFILYKELDGSDA